PTSNPRPSQQFLTARPNKRTQLFPRISLRAVPAEYPARLGSKMPPSTVRWIKQLLRSPRQIGEEPGNRPRDERFFPGALQLNQCHGEVDPVLRACPPSMICPCSGSGFGNFSGASPR